MNHLILTCVLMSVSAAAVGVEHVPNAGLRAEMEGRWDDAIKVYREVLRRDATQTQLWQRIADIYVRQGNVDAAVEALEQAVRHAPNDAPLWSRLSRTQASAKHDAAALDAIKHAVALEPKNLEYLRAQAVLANSNKDYALTVSSYSKALELVPDDAQMWFALSRVEANATHDAAALDAVKHAVALKPDNLEYLQAQAVLASSTKDYALSASSYARMHELAPSDVAATLGAARASVWEGNRDNAKKYYQAYVQAQPQDKVALMEYIELEAERGDYPAALAAGELYRKRFGESLEYWLRMADLYALAGNDSASAEALRHATQYSSQDPALFFRLAQSYPSLKDAPHAMAAINRAVELDPGNLEYLQSRADLASWGGDYATALDSYQRILAIEPDNPAAILGTARVNAWSGQIDEAEKYYRRYLAKHPQVQVVWIEYIEVETERGDYALAMKLLEDYRARFGETEPYKKQKARVLAWAGRPTPALQIVDELQQSLPNDYQVMYTRTVALNAAHRPREALASLDELTRLRAGMSGTEGIVPEQKEVDDLRRFIRTPLRSFVRLSMNYSPASDTTVLRQYGLDGMYSVSPETRLFGGTDRQRLHAALGSGFATPDGRENVAYNRTWVGLGHRFSPKVALDAQVGGGAIEGKHNTIYEVGADLQPKDELALRLFHRQDLFAVSPRAAVLGIQRRQNVLNGTWTPNLLYTVDGILAYDTLSDGNRRWELQLAPRRAFMRTQRLNLDLGVGGQWFSYRRDPGNGYYAPRMYRRYSVNVFTYWKISDDDGVSVTFSLGPYKDNTMTGYRTGGDIVIDATFGLYRDWMLNAQLSLSHYGGADTGAYRSRAFGLAVTRRF